MSCANGFATIQRNGMNSGDVTFGSLMLIPILSAPCSKPPDVVGLLLCTVRMTRNTTTRSH